MRDFNSEPKDIFPVNESAGGEHGYGGNLDYDGVVADHHDEGDIDDALPVSGSGHNGFEHAAAAEPEHSRGGVAVLERPNEVVDAVRDPRNPGVWYSDAYFDRINAPTHSIERGDVGAAAGGTPPGPPKPPSEYGAGFPAAVGPIPLRPDPKTAKASSMAPSP